MTGQSVEVGGPPDPRGVIDQLRDRLRHEQEKSLNSVDAVLGAQAAASQAKAETREVYHRLHVRETELAQLKELLTLDARSGPGARSANPTRPTLAAGADDDGGTAPQPFEISAQDLVPMAKGLARQAAGRLDRLRANAQRRLGPGSEQR